MRNNSDSYINPKYSSQKTLTIVKILKKTQKFSLISFFFLKCVLGGPCGKSTLIHRFISNQFEEAEICTLGIVKNKLISSLFFF